MTPPPPTFCPLLLTLFRLFRIASNIHYSLGLYLYNFTNHKRNPISYKMGFITECQLILQNTRFKDSGCMPVFGWVGFYNGLQFLFCCSEKPVAACQVQKVIKNCKLNTNMTTRLIAQAYI